MAKTAKQYEDEYYTAGKARIDTLHQQRKQADQQTIADADAALTRSAQVAADKYQQQIDAAPTEYQPLYDRNALSEALGRERAEMKMANMGMTDSGLSETSQAALSVQRGRADAAVSKDMREYVSGLETAISDVWAQKESALADKTMSINKATDDWYTGVTAQLASDAQTAGAQAYAADQEAAAAVEAARIKAQQEAEAARLDRLHDVNLKLLDGGATIEDVYGSNVLETNTALYGNTAAAASVEGVPDIDTAESVVPNSYRMQWNLGDRINVNTKGGYQGIVYIAEEVARQLAEGNQKYVTATAEQKNYAVAKAVGLEIKAIWGDSYKNNNAKKANVVRAMRQYFKNDPDYVDYALQKAGIDLNFADTVE